MDGYNLLNLAQRKAKSMIMVGLFLAAVSFLFLVVTQKNFKASTDLLVVQNQNGFTDYYALSKSADFLTNILVESVYSEKFLEEMNGAGVETAAFLPSNKLDRLKTWEKTVRIRRTANLGMIHIEVFGASQKQVADISNGVVSVLTNKNFLFLGKGQDLDVRVLNGPIWEKNPSLSQIALAMIGGFLVGALLSLFWAYFRNEKYYANESEAYLESLRNLHTEA